MVIERLFIIIIKTSLTSSPLNKGLFLPFHLCLLQVSLLPVKQNTHVVQPLEGDTGTFNKFGTLWCIVIYLFFKYKRLKSHLMRNIRYIFI